MAATSYLIHADLTGIARPLTWGSFVTGLVFWTIVPAAVMAAACAIYNRLAATSRVAHTWVPEEKTAERHVNR